MNLAPLLHRDVDVGGRADAAVDHLAALEVDRLVDDRQGGRALDRLRDRHVVPALLAEDDSLAGIEVGGGQVELFGEQAEVVDPFLFAERRGDVVADPVARVEAGGQGLGQADDHVHRREPAHPGQAAGKLERAQRQHRRLLEEAEVVGLEHLAEIEVLELGGDAPVDHLHHFVGRDAVGEHAGDEGAGAGADVDVEVVDRAVDREQVEGAQGADLVDAAGEAAAAEDKGGLGGPFTVAASSRLRLYVHNFAHKHALSH